MQLVTKHFVAEEEDWGEDGGWGDEGHGEGGGGRGGQPGRADARVKELFEA